MVDGPFAVVNADDFYGLDAYHTMCSHLANMKDQDCKLICCMVGYRLGDTISPHGYVARGECRLGKDGNLKQIVERTRIARQGDAIGYPLDDGKTWRPLAPDTVVSMNFWGFTDGVFGELEAHFARFLDDHARHPTAEFLIPRFVDALLVENRATVKVFPTRARWFGVTYREDHAAAQRAIRMMVDDRAYPNPLWGR